MSPKAPPPAPEEPGPPPGSPEEEEGTEANAAAEGAEGEGRPASDPDPAEDLFLAFARERDGGGADADPAADTRAAGNGAGEADPPGGEEDEVPERTRPPEPEAGLAVRLRPRPVARLNRKLVAALAAGGVLALAAVLAAALDPPRAVEEAEGPVGVPISGRPRHDLMERLPRNYGEVEPPRPPASEAAPGTTAPGLPVGGSAVPGDALAERLAEEALLSEIFAYNVTEGAPAAETGPPPSARPVAAPPAATADAGADTVPSQARKEAFLDGVRGDAVHNPHPVEDPLSPWQVMAGTVLRAALVTAISSDLPGFVIAQVTEDVRDTATGRVVLIPRGARLLGRYDSFVAFGQERILLAWNRIVFPDGSSMTLENLPAADAQGRAGVDGEVDFHTWALVKGVVLSTLFGVGTELAFDDEGPLERALRRSAQGSVADAGGRIVRRQLDIQPTLTAPAGWPVAVIVHRDLVLRPWRG